MILPGVWCSGMFLAYAFLLIDQIHFILSVYSLCLPIIYLLCFYGKVDYAEYIGVCGICTGEDIQISLLLHLSF